MWLKIHKCNELWCVSVNNLHTCTLMHAYLHTITLPCTTLVLVLGMVNVILVQKFSLLQIVFPKKGRFHCNIPNRILGGDKRDHAQFWEQIKFYDDVIFPK